MTKHKPNPRKENSVNKNPRKEIVSMEPTNTNEFVKSCRCCQFIK